jgi:hypothetical protein
MASFEGRHQGDRGRQSIDFGRERFVGKILKVGCRGIVVQRELVLLVSRCWGSGRVGWSNHDVILRSVATDLIEETRVQRISRVRQVAARRLEAAPKWNTSALGRIPKIQGPVYVRAWPVVGWRSTIAG